jgi:hypothetical protein
MEIKELALKVQAVRDAQKKYFRERTQSSLQHSKVLEKEIDDIIADIIDPSVKNQTKLF